MYERDLQHEIITVTLLFLFLVIRVLDYFLFVVW
jgi:hypothetical protein